MAEVLFPNGNYCLDWLEHGKVSRHETPSNAIRLEVLVSRKGESASCPFVWLMEFWSWFRKLMARVRACVLEMCDVFALSWWGALAFRCNGSRNCSCAGTLDARKVRVAWDLHFYLAWSALDCAYSRISKEVALTNTNTARHSHSSTFDPQPFDNFTTQHLMHFTINSYRNYEWSYSWGL